ncbi:MAG: hypothetical protein BroJett015_10680 [Chloroflexota bacterium]|nr:zf-HC2 domain-containing protein [Ardenticatenaceae bacterium]GIK55405.1 MAG: hypothetical protein BroJett015_10680 [Chloroflexota bacterium]
MFDFLRNWTKSAAARHQEAISAYLDNALSPAERQRFEQQMAQDPALQAEVAQQQQTRALLRQLPPRQVPRNFTLDPALYGRPARQPLITYYPTLRAATVLTAVLFFFVIGLNLFMGGSASMAPAADMAVSQLTAETTSEEPTAGMAFESAPAAAPFSVEEPALEEAASDSAAIELAATAAAPLPAVPTPAATQAPEAQTAPLPTATVSNLPRPIATEVVAERAATAEITAPLPTQPETDTAVTNITPPIEAVDILTQPQETSTQTPAPSIDLLAVAPIGLLVLLALLSILTLYARRKLP